MPSESLEGRTRRCWPLTPRTRRPRRTRRAAQSTGSASSKRGPATPSRCRIPACTAACGGARGGARRALACKGGGRCRGTRLHPLRSRTAKQERAWGLEDEARRPFHRPPSRLPISLAPAHPQIARGQAAPRASHLARVTATFMRRLSARKPTSPCGLHRTMLITTASFSRLQGQRSSAAAGCERGPEPPRPWPL